MGFLIENSKNSLRSSYHLSPPESPLKTPLCLSADSLTMLGKRARSIHRTASICELNAPAAAGSHRIEPPPAVMQQVIGFNPTTGRKDANPINAAVVDSPNNYQSSSGGDRPRSALQSLLAAATRQRQNNGGNPTATMNYNHEQNMSIKGGGSNSSSPKEAFLLHHSRRRNEPPSPVATGARRINGHGNSISPFLFQLPSSSPLDTILHGTPQANLLKSCCFCKRLLGPGRDIYMYRGDKAFCSVECRYEQIMLDERKNGFILNSPSSRVTQRSSHHPSILNIGNVGAS